MATIAENIQTLRSIKSDIKNAITDKGGNIGNDFKTYAQAITDLPSGGGNEDLINLIERDVTTLNIPDGTTKIGDYAVYEYRSLTEVTIPNTVTSIGAYAFDSCRELTDVTIPETVTTIGDSAFRECHSFRNVIIPSSVTNIDTWAFYQCAYLNSITVLAATPPTLGSNTFSVTNSCPIYVPAESVDAYKAATNWSAYADRIQAIPTV